MERTSKRQDHNHYLQHILNDMEQGVIAADLSGKILWMNHYALKVFNLDKKTAIGKRFEQIFPNIPEELNLIPDKLLKGITERNKPFRWNVNGKPMDFLRDTYKLNDETGRQIGAFILFREAVHLFNIDEKIQRADRLAMIGQMAAGTAHEIRNPLTAIRGFLQMIGSSLEEKGLERERGYIDLMLTEVMRINNLVDQFLLLGKPRNIQYRILDLNQVLEEIIPMVESEATLHSIEITNRRLSSLPKIIADPELIKQLFLNLIKNAIEAIGEEGNIEIDYDINREEQKLMVSIRDSGPGIPPYIIDRIFDPFYTTKENGTGLGLSVCQRIVQDIGGSIRVSSKGFGTTFQVSLPFLHSSLI
ncbi:two-component system sensor histidine kinase NtrB [Thermicanus aegyptius]|uniref:two-component system sensor histidine kinase NtrB n=1 Tax=Thermicanus aegyptius TaxID=94009 RepID=UPI00034B4558|nr:ATP-binding protein [Thermicanus aegyptius]